MKDKTIKIKVYCNTGFTGCNHNYIETIKKAEWNKMTEVEKEKFLDDIAFENMSNNIEYGAYVLEDK